MFPNLKRARVIAIDTETYGLEWFKSRAERKPHVFGVSVAVRDGESVKSWYWDIRESPHVMSWLGDLVKAGVKFVNHNIKFDIHSLAVTGVLLDPAKCECTMIRAALIDEHLREYSLDFLSAKYLKKRKEHEIYSEMSKMFGGPDTRKAQMPNISMAPSNIVEPYAKVDAELALELWEWQEREIERQDLFKIVKFEQELFPHIVEMESKGIRVDVERANSTVDKLNERIDAMQDELDELAGFHVNPNPSESIKKLFKPERVDGVWKLLDGTVCPETPSGAPSLGADTLRSMTHPCANLILSTRKLIKTRDTFVKGHILSNVYDGYVFPNINQTKSDSGGGVEGTGTGRFSYTRPALQQIPARDRFVAEIVRPIFLPDDGCLWSYGDLDQHEFRIFVHYAKPKSLLEAYAEDPNLDIHQKVADMTGLPRSAKTSGGPNAKQLNLGMVFCMGAGLMAQKMGLPYHEEEVEFRGEGKKTILVAGDEAKEVMERYYSEVPGVREMAKKAASVAKSRGYVKTIMGRHIRFPGGKFVHKASGLIYQGSSADLNKSNVIRICEYLKQAGVGRLLLNIHDEYSVSIRKDVDLKKVLKDLQGLVQDRPELRVPIRIDFSQGKDNWWDATEAGKAT